MATTRRGITREELAQFLPSHKLIKAFESLTEGVTVVLPTELDAIRIQVEEVALATGAAQNEAMAALAMAAVAVAEVAAQELADCRTQFSALSAEVDVLRTQVQALQVAPV
ncbi:hypothetical protein [Hydrogenophaga sp.]|uniref:hypothetical protein n=1 Tax=Hydrogenophaga sp. TaxID=1904254 RepID=UPI003D0DF97A